MLKAMVIRNLKLFFRDKAAVFFSLLGVLIIIFLYILFLGTLVMEMARGFFNNVITPTLAGFLFIWVIAEIKPCELLFIGHLNFPFHVLYRCINSGNHFVDSIALFKEHFPMELECFPAIKGWIADYLLYLF